MKFTPTLLMAAITLFAAPAGAAPVLSDAQILLMLKERVDVEKQNSGIVVGLIDGNGRRIISYGVADKQSGREVDGNTVFEIASLSKLFTSLLLADMVEKGEVRLSDPVQMYLPASVKVPSQGDHQITLLDLSTHRSGLPREPDNFKRVGAVREHYTAGQLHAFLSGYRLTRDIGARAEYSNLGVGLLGHALSLRAGTDYDSLVRTRILLPLGMRSTGVVADAAMLARRAPGYYPDGTRAPDWGYPILAGAGALQSSANDMLTFLSVSMMQAATPLSSAMERMQRPIPEQPELRLAWGVGKKYNSEIWSHVGSTWGYASYLGFDKDRGRGVIVLSNTPVLVDDIGSKILNSQYRLRQYLPPPAFANELDRTGYRDVPGTYDKHKRDDPDFFLDERVLNEWGLGLLAQGKVDPAIDLLKLAVRLRPKSANTYDSLAEGYEKKGSIALAVENYQRSLDLAPDNVHAIERLKTLAPASGASK